MNIMTGSRIFAVNSGTICASVVSMESTLSTIMFYLENLEESSKEPDKVLEYTKNINDKVVTMDHMIGDILLLSRSESGKIVLNIEEISLKELESNYSRQVNAGLSEVTAKLQEVRMNMKKYDLSKDYHSLTSPVSGNIQSIAVNTIGETVSPSEKLVTIVPDDAEVEMECYVKNMDIADINHTAA